jgi:membrane-bound lytic murein transglycosylase A
MACAFAPPGIFSQLRKSALRMAPLAFVLAGCVSVEKAPVSEWPLEMQAVSFGDLKGWANEDARAALAAFRLSCGKLAAMASDQKLGGAGYAGTAGDWRAPCAAAQNAKASDAKAARQFFETIFVPYRIVPHAEGAITFTGYYEPLLRASRTRHGAYQTPLYGVPPDLITVDLGAFRSNLAGQRIAGRVSGSKLVPYADRAEIARKGLPQAKTLFYADDPVDVFFLQIQGSGRIMLDDGSTVRAVYAAQNGHPYTAIGGVLVNEGAMTRDNMSMQNIRTWLDAHPERREEIFDKNASYVFFDEKPLNDPELGAPGAEGVALTPRVSLAVDRTFHALGTPLWVETETPQADASAPPGSFDHVMIAQDTGGAIKGAVRGDIYWGFSNEASAIAGRMKGQGTLTVFVPKAVAARLGNHPRFAGPGT